MISWRSIIVNSISLIMFLGVIYYGRFKALLGVIVGMFLMGYLLLSYNPQLYALFELMADHRRGDD